MYERMENIKQSGATILFISHDSNQVKRLCENAIWLSHGIVQKIGSVDETCEAYERSFRKR